MLRDPLQYLHDAREAAAAIEEFTAGKSFHDYCGDRQLQAAVEREFEIMGEALGQLARREPELAARIPDIRQIVSFRNLLIHGYAVVNEQIVWSAVHEHLPALRETLDLLLAEADPGA